MSGGQTRTPASEDILAAIQSVPAQTVLVLPNNKNIIMAAEQAQKLARALGRELVREAGTAAFTGRAVIRNPGKPTERKFYYSAPKAYNRFRIELAKVYPTDRKVE